MLRRVFDNLLIVCFIAVLCVPMSVQLFQEKPEVSIGEKRQLNPFPKLAINRNAINSFPEDFDLWMKDHFGLRGVAIAAHNHLKVRLLKTSPLPDQVILGMSRKWLYLAYPNYIHSYLQDIPFPEKKISYYEQSNVDRHRWCAERGILYAWLLAPVKSNVYPEHLPRWMVKRGDQNRLDLFMKRMEKHPDVLILDAIPVLEASKGEHPLYHPDDTHWNLRGVYSIYPWLIQQLQEREPRLKPLPPERVQLVTVPGAGGNLARFLDMREYYSQDVHTIKIHNPSAKKVTLEHEGLVIPPRVRLDVYERPGASGVSAIVFSDSFGNQLHSLFSETFRRVVFVRGGTYFWKELIEAERPDIVLRVNVESCLLSAREVERHLSGADSSRSR